MVPADVGPPPLEVEQQDQQRERPMRLGWTCRQCFPATPDLTTGAPETCQTIPSEEGAHTSTVELPIQVCKGPPSVQADRWFELKVAANQVGSIRCRWVTRHLRSIRYDDAFRNIEAFLAMETPGPQQSSRGQLWQLSMHPHTQALCLETDASTGHQLLACSIFARTAAASSTTLLLSMGVSSTVRQKGIGRWMLNWVYLKGVDRKDLQMVTNAEPKGFLSHMGFLETQKRSKFATLGAGVLLERKQALGAPLEITLENALYSRGLDPVQRMYLPSLSSAGALAGDGNSCFATAAIQALISIPQAMHLLMRRPGKWESVQHLLTRIITRVILGDPSGADAEAVALLRDRLDPDFGQNHTSKRRARGEGGKTGFGRAQHDIADFLAAVMLKTSEVQELKQGLEPVKGEARSIPELFAWTGVHRRECLGCRTTWEVEDTGAGGELRHGPQRQAVTTVDGLLDPAFRELSIMDDKNLPLRLSGCLCVKPNTAGMMEMTSYPACLRVEVPRATYVRATESRAAHCARDVNRVDAPMNLGFCMDGEVVSPLYKLRAVTVATRNESTAAGHYATLKIAGGTGHLCDGLSVKTVELVSPKSLVLNEIPSCQDYVITCAYYSVEVDGEEETERLHRNYFTPPSARGEEPQSKGLLGSAQSSSGKEAVSDQEARAMTKRRRHGRPPEQYEKAVEYLRDIVPAGIAFTLAGAETDPSNGLMLLHSCLEEVHRSETPLFAWLHTPEVDWMDSLSEARCLHVNRAGAVSGLGRRTNLRGLIDSMAAENGRADPWISTGAITGGLGGIRQASEYMKAIEEACDGELSLENGLLISQAGARTDCHMHAGPVVVQLVGAGLQSRNAETGLMGAVVQRPREGDPFPIRKYYLLFDSRTLERAGIPVFDTSATMPLFTLLNRIRLCTEEQQSQIRWFHGCVDGATYNTVIWPSTMWHWVLTLSADVDERRLWIGLATQFIPRKVESRAAIDATLQRTAATDEAGRPVVELDHLRLQTSSVYLAQMVRQLVEKQGAALRLPTWHQHLAMEAAKEQMRIGEGQEQAGNQEAAWSTLEAALTSLRETFPLGHSLTVTVAKAQLRVLTVMQRAGEKERKSRSTTHGSHHAGKP